MENIELGSKPEKYEFDERMLPTHVEYVTVADLDSDIILESDNAAQMAHKIFYNFQIGQSCTIEGWVIIEHEQKTIPKGEYALEIISKLDEMVNCNTSRSDGRIRRNRVKLPNTVGGFVAQKIFKWDVRMMDNKPRFTVWRIQ